MKKLNRGLVVSMALTFMLTSSMAPEVFAAQSKHTTVEKQDKNASQGNGQEKKAEESTKSEDKESKKEIKLNVDNTKEDTEKEALEEQKKALEAEKDKLEEQKESLEKQYEAAKESGNAELAAQLKVQLDQVEKDFEALKEQAAQKRAEIKAAIKSEYTASELAALKEAGDSLKKKDKNITVLPVENIIVKGKKVKFDTPPVIKSGRTLIPVRALSQAFGAEVKWIAAEKKVVITKGTTEIVMYLDSYKMYVNGVETKLDVPATSMNGRTVVPLKFIVENLGLKVKWNSDTKDVEIEEPDAPVTPPVNTTGSAITVDPTTNTTSTVTYVTVRTLR